MDWVVSIILGAMTAGATIFGIYSQMKKVTKDSAQALIDNQQEEIKDLREENRRLRVERNLGYEIAAKASDEINKLKNELSQVTYSLDMMKRRGEDLKAQELSKTGRMKSLNEPTQGKEEKKADG